MANGSGDYKGVIVLDIHGERLANCTHRKARVLLSEKKARVAEMRPYTIQLFNVTGVLRSKTAEQAEG